MYSRWLSQSFFLITCTYFNNNQNSDACCVECRRVFSPAQWRHLALTYSLNLFMSSFVSISPLLSVFVLKATARSALNVTLASFYF